MVINVICTEQADGLVESLLYNKEKPIVSGIYNKNLGHLSSNFSFAKKDVCTFFKDELKSLFPNESTFEFVFEFVPYSKPNPKIPTEIEGERVIWSYIPNDAEKSDLAKCYPDAYVIIEREGTTILYILIQNEWHYKGLGGGMNIINQLLKELKILPCNEKKLD